MPRVLVAEDDELVCSYLLRCLERGGYDAEGVADGVSAIVKLAHGSWDVLVTDFDMPRANGLEVIEAARRLDPTLPCVMVTATGDMDMAMRAVATGASGFLPKPIRPDHLLVVVGSALEKRRLAVDATRMRLMGPMLDKFAMILANTLEAKDLSTQRHCERLVDYAERVATRLEMTPTDGRIVRHHHERFDGSGYPDRLRGTGIPLGARVVSVVDAFDVMSAGRPYCAPRPQEAALAELVRRRGSQFDPDVVDTFVRLIEETPPALLLVGQPGRAQNSLR